MNRQRNGDIGYRLLQGAMAVYRYTLSPILQATQRTLVGHTSACRFQPTCSEYAHIAFHLYGWRHGGMLALRRLLRCHPFASGGFDPVPVPNREKGDRFQQSAEALHPSKAAGHLP
jgi:putative membrane protein insertion efficiency factor